ncbi:MAG: acyl-CoA dehydratase activase-related protein [Bacteroides sp.]|nr:acyl-CoA dehydratase activase-related protein [Bacteroides sp.]
MSLLNVGLDIGSTTAKAVVTDSEGQLIFFRYIRHHADVFSVVISLLREISPYAGSEPVSFTLTGSVGLGMAEKYSLPFVQEVVAATRWVETLHPQVSTLIDIGGEDAKIVYFREGGASELRMNGNCAGGTGAFIDQMALLLGISVEEMDAYASRSSRIYPIASRCGVFSKTDVQNLISKHVDKADIVASVFRAVAVQTATTLSHGCDVKPSVLLCGGPLSFISGLRKAFMDYLQLPATDFVIPEHSHLIPAWGAALCKGGEQKVRLAELLTLLENDMRVKPVKAAGRLKPIFCSEEEYEAWKQEKGSFHIDRASLAQHTGPAYLGIDSGSTTTKIVVIDSRERLLFSYYTSNNGDPVQAVKEGLRQLQQECEQAGCSLELYGGCSTGYGEDLIKAAFQLDTGVIETMAHYLAARHIRPDVSFILDIGGQDMKAIFTDQGLLSRMEINEACSSGCGSFLETFARTLEYEIPDFARLACTASAPCDLGTRCTVFMNSKVKQVLREGASVGDIAAGLSFSVVKNCLYTVLKLKDTSEMGDTIVVQGGTLRNDSIVRALELLTGKTVYRSDLPELMGAYGCALYAQTVPGRKVSVPRLLERTSCEIRTIRCRGCENRCLVQSYRFSAENVYYAGNKCEKIFSNRGNQVSGGYNVYTDKYRLLFERPVTGRGDFTIGIPRCLHMYEEYPFWHALFEACGIRIVLSERSTFPSYEAGVRSVMSDNICFPAKLVHSHIYDLMAKKVDRIFFPYVIYEQMEGKGGMDSFNCPIVSGYSDVIKSAITPDIPVDAPVISFKDRKLLARQCREYLSALPIDPALIPAAISHAWKAQEEYKRELLEVNRTCYQQACEQGALVVLLAGRPYHTDPLIQHKLADLIAAMGVTVLTEDIARREDSPGKEESHFISRWAYAGRIMKAARWATLQPQEIHYMQMTSFGCGPDAFLLDEVGALLRRYGKAFTLLKVDDVNNIGSLKLRVRSVIESLRFSRKEARPPLPFVTTASYEKPDRKRKIIAPHFTGFISPLLPAIFELAGYEMEILPPSDTESAEYGLRYANNEVCYPATLVVGDILKALRSGVYDPAQTAVAITQTGGQCRASSYISLIKKAMADAGFAEVPVISIAMGSGLVNEQPGFRIDWLRVLPMVVTTVLYSDCISKFYYASVVREKSCGEATRLRDHYLDAARPVIVKNDRKQLIRLLAEAATAFDRIVREDVCLPKVGIVGEIYLKYNSFSHKDIVRWLVDRRIEVIPPLLTPFFLQSFVNTQVNRQTYLERTTVPGFVVTGVYKLISRHIARINREAAAFRYFTPFTDIFKEAHRAREVVSLSAQFGEGWLLPAEVISCARSGHYNVISLQPFGCIANHVISKGIEKRIKSLYPRMNLLSLDFDSGVSDVNVINRLLLFVDHLK